jgi:putative regulatory protein, FmdB family
MPTYEFRCPKGHDFEKFYRSIGSAPTEVHCPECGALAERQLSAGAGLVFKGSGFYITDYGKDGKKDQRTAGAAAKTDSGPSGKSDSSSSDKSDSGSAKTPDSGSSESSPAPSSDKKTGTSDSKSSSATTESKPAASPAPARKKDSK